MLIIKAGTYGKHSITLGGPEGEMDCWAARTGSYNSICNVSACNDEMPSSIDDVLSYLVPMMNPDVTRLHLLSMFGRDWVGVFSE